MMFIFVLFAVLATDALAAQRNSTTQPTTCLTFAFDDTFKTGEEMAGYLEPHGWKATFYISPG